MRRAAKVDRNHAEVVAALRKAGCGVLSLAAVGNGCPDLLVTVGGRSRLLEIKDGKRPPSERRLTPDQVEFHAKWPEPIPVVLSVEDALKAVGL